MNSNWTFKTLMAALSLATTVGLAPDAFALGGMTGSTMAKPQDTAPLLELARERDRDHRRDPPSRSDRDRDHRRDPSSSDRDRGPHTAPSRPHPYHPYVGQKTPPKGGNVPWKKKYPSKI